MAKQKDDTAPTVPVWMQLLDKVRRLNPKGLRFDARGKFYPDPTPLAPPLGWKPRESISDQIRRVVRSEQLRLEAEAAGAETFEEADDFDVGDDWDPTSPYEVQFDPEWVDKPPIAPTEASQPHQPVQPDTPATPPPEEPLVAPATAGGSTRVVR